MIKYFFLNAEEKFVADDADPYCCFREKRKNRLTPTHSIPKNDVTERKARQMVFESVNSLTVY